MTPMYEKGVRIFVAVHKAVKLSFVPPGQLCPEPVVFGRTATELAAKYLVDNRHLFNNSLTKWTRLITHVCMGTTCAVLSMPVIAPYRVFRRWTFSKKFFWRWWLGLGTPTSKYGSCKSSIRLKS